MVSELALVQPPCSISVNCVAHRMALMTNDEILALLILLTAERRLQAADIGEGLTGRIGSESARMRGLEVLRSLARGGAACRIRGPHSPWEITEKGRIAIYPTEPTKCVSSIG
jgi:hypothetical protein